MSVELRRFATLHYYTEYVCIFSGTKATRGPEVDCNILCHLGPGKLPALRDRWLPNTVTILDRFHCTVTYLSLQE